MCCILVAAFEAICLCTLWWNNQGLAIKNVHKCKFYFPCSAQCMRRLTLIGFICSLSLSLTNSCWVVHQTNKNKKNVQSPFFPWNIFGQQNHSSRTGRETLQLFVSISAIKFKVLINPLCHYCPWLGVLNVNLMTDRCKQSTMLALSRIWPRWVLKLYNFLCRF